ncbi:MAG: PEP-CTERM sorting domain-containing protein [Microcystis sp. LE19-338.1B]|jgi:hypothetical protein|nr:PEP-CTERM sorting domain-containing protein [Microcystis sp. LE19-338.1B]MCZ8358614.1 PEP-CTERM sorting domain-containing protein [Microcystis sp. LE19-388.1G]
MKKWKNLATISGGLILSFVTLYTEYAQAGIEYKWTSTDRSIATITVQPGESIPIPMKDGRIYDAKCLSSFPCKETLADFKDKKGNITYENFSRGLQNISGTINSGTGSFRITTNGDLEGLFSDVTVSAKLINSTGFNLIVGSPGDQISQGGAINYSTQWFSDQAIGIDPITGVELILGNFFLDSTDPLTEFEYIVTDPYLALISSTFTIGEKYTFSTGLEISGTVTKELITLVPVPEPTSILSLLALGTLGAASTIKRKLKPSQSTEKETTKVS